MEEWIPLQDYPGYSASNMGKIRNDARSRILATVPTASRYMYVSLMQNGKQVTRGVAKLIAQTFVPNPRPDQFDTPIHLDGDTSNSQACNLLWRPRWFAIKFTVQFYSEIVYRPKPILNITTGEIFEDIWDVVKRDGVLYQEVVLAISNKTFVFPTMDVFEWFYEST